MSSSETVTVTVEFRYPITHLSPILKPIPPTNPSRSGGLELLFSNQRKHTLTLPSTPPTTIRALVLHLCDTLMKDPRRDLFVMDGTVYVAFSLLLPSYYFPTSSLPYF